MTAEPRTPGRPTVFEGPWRELADAVGGVVALSELLQVSRKQLHRWATGEVEPAYLEKLGLNAVAHNRGCRAVFPRLR
jgi:hypothetical protein